MRLGPATRFRFWRCPSWEVSSSGPIPRTGLGSANRDHHRLDWLRAAPRQSLSGPAGAALLASLLGGLEHMYRWHHRLGMAAYVALLVHPLMLAGASLSSCAEGSLGGLSPLSESWPVWTGWLSLLLLMAGLSTTFIGRLSYRIRRPVHAALGVAVPVGLIHLHLLGIDEPVAPLLVAVPPCSLGASFARIGAWGRIPMSFGRWRTSLPTLSRSVWRLSARPSRCSLASSPS